MLTFYMHLICFSRQAGEVGLTAFVLQRTEQSPGEVNKEHQWQR